MESFQTIKGTHLGQTPFQNVVGGGSGFGDSGGEGRDGRCWEHQVITQSVYMKLCVLEMLRGKKGALFFQAAWNVWRTADVCFISICDPTPGD